jgi:hypothetical protein
VFTDLWIEQVFYHSDMVKRPANHTKPKPERVVRHVWVHESPTLNWQGLLIGSQTRNGIDWPYVALIDMEQTQSVLTCRWVLSRHLSYVPSSPPEMPY